MKILKGLKQQSQTQRKAMVLFCAIFFNSLSLLISISMEGTPQSFTTSLLIHDETDYWVDAYPELYELVITADETNIENISITVWRWFYDYVDRRNYNLTPGERISSKSDWFLDDDLSLTFQNTSTPQGVYIRIEGRSATLGEILHGPGTYDSFFYVFVIFLPSIGLSLILALSIVIYAGVKSRDSKQAILYYSNHSIFPFICLILFSSKIILVPTVVCIYYCIFIISRDLGKSQIIHDPDLVASGGTVAVTSLLLFRIYLPLNSQLYNGQEIWNFLPILPVTVSLLITGLVMVILGGKRHKQQTETLVF